MVMLQGVKPDEDDGNGSRSLRCLGIAFRKISGRPLKARSCESKQD